METTYKSAAFAPWQTIGFTQEECDVKWNEQMKEIATSAQTLCDTKAAELAHTKERIGTLSTALQRSIPTELQAVSSCSLRDQLANHQQILVLFQEEAREMEEKIVTHVLHIGKWCEKLEQDVDAEYATSGTVTRKREMKLKIKLHTLKQEFKERNELLRTFTEDVNALIREFNDCSTKEQDESKEEKNEGILPEIQDMPVAVESFAVLNERRFYLERQLREYRRLKPRADIETCRAIYETRQDNKKIVQEEEFKAKMRELMCSANRQKHIEYKRMEKMSSLCRPKAMLRLMNKWKDYLETWERTYGTDEPFEYGMVMRGNQLVPSAQEIKYGHQPAYLIDMIQEMNPRRELSRPAPTSTPSAPTTPLHGGGRGGGGGGFGSTTPRNLTPSSRSTRHARGRSRNNSLELAIDSPLSAGV